MTEVDGASIMETGRKLQTFDARKASGGNCVRNGEQRARRLAAAEEKRWCWARISAALRLDATYLRRLWR